MTGRGLPLAAWAGLMLAGSVLAATGVAAGLLLLTGRADPVVLEALAAGSLVGLLLSLVGVVAAARVGQGLRRLKDDALRRVEEPDAPVVGHARSGPSATSAEIVELARVLDALHQRVRLSDELARRHRRDAETASAGVFELLSGLVAAEEGARGQLAAELHDTVAQSLMLARGLLAAGALTPSELVRVTDHVEDAEEQVRAVMARTRPPALQDGDLASAVAGLQADLRARYALEVSVTWPQTPYPLPSASAITVYRFFQEALLNVVKHADVDEAELLLEVDDDGVRAVVRDAGPGFDMSEVRPDRGRHVGLGLLRERARLTGGRLEVDSRLGEGTTLTLRLPRPAPPLLPADPLPADPLPRVLQQQV